MVVRDAVSGEFAMDVLTYRGYLVHFRAEVLSWRFMAAPPSELPILSRGASRQFPSREEALAEAKKQIDHLLLG